MWEKKKDWVSSSPREAFRHLANSKRNFFQWTRKKTFSINKWCDALINLFCLLRNLFVSNRDKAAQSVRQTWPWKRGNASHAKPRPDAIRNEKLCALEVMIRAYVRVRRSFLIRWNSKHGKGFDMTQFPLDSNSTQPFYVTSRKRASSCFFCRRVH